MNYIRPARFAVAVLLVLTAACSKKDDVGRMRVVLPKAPTTSKSSGSTSLQSVSAQSNGTDWNATINPTAGSEINCFAVFVGGGELGANSCAISNGTKITFGPHVGFRKPGEEIWVDTPAGDRTIYVIGLKAATAAACSDFTNSEPDGANLSEPFLIAAQKSNVPSGSSSITINAALDTSKKIQDCTFISPVGGGQQSPFGDKRDGKISTSIPTAYLDGSIDNLGVSGITHIAAAGQLASTKIFNATRRVTSVVNSGADAGKLITLGSAFSSSEFEVGDEVVWYVAAGASSLGSPDDNTLGACGGGLYIGRYGTSKITSTPTSTQLLLESALSSTPAGINNTNLAAPSNTANFCTVVVSRVSSFEQIDVPATYSLQLMPSSFDYANGVGGIMAIRADTVTVDGTLVLYGSGTGFNGGASGYQGDGLNSLGGYAYNSNYNGGGGGNPSSIAGGGGSNAGIGGDGASNNGSGGTSVSHCNGLCTPFVDKKAYMGGGGGGASGAGGRGGGLVLLFAKSITGIGNVYLKADGASGTGGSAAGGSGAGGTVGLFAKLVSVGSVTLQAKGGNGVSVGGSGGGGGVVEVRRCPAGWSSVLNTYADGGTQNGAGTAGGSGLVNISDDTAICSIN